MDRNNQDETASKRQRVDYDSGEFKQGEGAHHQEEEYEEEAEESKRNDSARRHYDQDTSSPQQVSIAADQVENLLQLSGWLQQSRNTQQNPFAAAAALGNRSFAYSPQAQASLAPFLSQTSAGGTLNLNSFLQRYPAANDILGRSLLFGGTSSWLRPVTIGPPPLSNLLQNAQHPQLMPVPSQASDQDTLLWRQLIIGNGISSSSPEAQERQRQTDPMLEPLLNSTGSIPQIHELLRRRNAVTSAATAAFSPALALELYQQQQQQQQQQQRASIAGLLNLSSETSASRLALARRSGGGAMDPPAIPTVATATAPPPPSLSESAMAALNASSTTTTTTTTTATSSSIRHQKEAKSTSLSSLRAPTTTDALSPTEPSPRRLTGKGPVSLSMNCDVESLSPFQCLVREQIELFEAQDEETRTNARGRNKQIALGQVGVRCRHCSGIPIKERARSSMYYPKKLDRLYQACQTLANVHLCEYCTHMPPEIRTRLLRLRERKTNAMEGKKYWADGARACGVSEDEEGLCFVPSSP